MWKRASRTGAPTASEDEHEARLLRLARGGDVHAFELLYRRYFPRLMRFLDRAIRRPNLCEEVVNDTMLTVWNSARRYDGSCKLSTWIFAIAWRKAMKAARGYARTPGARRARRGIFAACHGCIGSWPARPR